MANGSTINPLGEQHLKTLNTCLAGCAAGLDLCGRCQRAGLDVAAVQEELQNQQRVAQGLKREFFPNQP